MCDKPFPTQVSLGGHVSKAHKNQSEAYRKKEETRKSREHERLALNIARNLLHGVKTLDPVSKTREQSKLKIRILKLRRDEIVAGFDIDSLEQSYYKQLIHELSTTGKQNVAVKYMHMFGLA